MKTPFESEWMRYFQQEKMHLQRAVPLLKTLYPQVADFLKSLGPDTQDSVETWVDVLAWMTAGLKQKIDHRFSTWLESLLHVVSPELTHPFPACGIVQMHLPSERMMDLDGYILPKNTGLYAPLKNDQKAIFSIGVDTEYQAFFIQSTSFEPLPGGLRGGLGLKIVLRSLTHPGAYLGRTLRFAILGDLASAQALYSAIHAHASEEERAVFWQTHPNDAPCALERKALKRVGWNPEDALCTYPYPIHPGRRLLLEYYAFPQRFLFFDLTLPSEAPKHLSHDLTLWICLPSFFEIRKVSLPSPCLALNACPVINLFSASSLPMILDQASEAYLLEIDTAQEKCIHHIQEVYAITAQEQARTLQPAFTPPVTPITQPENTLRWHTRQEQTEKRKRVWLSFENMPQEAFMDGWCLYARTLCYQPNAIIQSIQIEREVLAEEAPYASFVWRWLSVPTDVSNADPQTASYDTQWISDRLLKEVTLTNISLWLEVYKQFQNPLSPPEWQWIQSMTCDSDVGRLHQEAWRGFVPQKTYVFTLKRQDSGAVPILFYHLLDGLIRAFHPMHVLCQTKIQDAKTQEILTTLPADFF